MVSTPPFRIVLFTERRNLSFAALTSALAGRFTPSRHLPDMSRLSSFSFGPLLQIFHLVTPYFIVYLRLIRTYRTIRTRTGPAALINFLKTTDLSLRIKPRVNLDFRLLIIFRLNFRFDFRCFIYPAWFFSGLSIFSVLHGYPLSLGRACALPPTLPQNVTCDRLWRFKKKGRDSSRFLPTAISALQIETDRIKPSTAC
jgi:hypothetical protein